MKDTTRDVWNYSADNQPRLTLDDIRRSRDLIAQIPRVSMELTLAPDVLAAVRLHVPDALSIGIVVYVDERLPAGRWHDGPPRHPWRVG